MGRKSISIELQKNIILLCDIGISQHEISRQLKISRRCIRQTIRKFDRFHNVTTKPGAGRPQKVTDRDKKPRQIGDERRSLPGLVRYAHTDLN